MTIADTPLEATEAFPKAEVEASLREELTAAAKMEAELRGTSWPEDVAAQRAVPLRVDSLVVIEILCTVESVPGFEISGSVVRAGGYESVDQAVRHLIPGWKENGANGKEEDHERCDERAAQETPHGSGSARDCAKRANISG